MYPKSSSSNSPFSFKYDAVIFSFDNSIAVWSCSPIASVSFIALPDTTKHSGLIRTAYMRSQDEFPVPYALDSCSM